MSTKKFTPCPACGGGGQTGGYYYHKYVGVRVDIEYRMNTAVKTCSRCGGSGVVASK